MENKLFTFIRPYLNFIDNGNLYRKPFSWLYKIVAIINLILPLYLLFKAIDMHIFDMPGKIIVFFLLCWVILTFTSWICFQLWWDRSAKVNLSSNEGDDFVATPVFAHLIQTSGEWLGTFISINGFAIGLLGTIFLGDESGAAESLFPFFKAGLAVTIIMPIYGFLIIIFSRFIAEQARALSSIANNTKKN